MKYSSWKRALFGFALLATLLLVPPFALATESNDANDGALIVASGECGESITWSLDSNGLLLIEGSGAIPDYSMHSKNMPWSEYSSSIRTIEIREGITSIGEDAFSYTGVRAVRLPSGLTSIDECAF